MSKLMNAFRMLEMLSVRTVVPLSELGEALELSDRSVQRLRDDLIDAGFDIETVHGPQGGYQLKNAKALYARTLSEDDKEQIEVGLKYLVQHEASLFDASFSVAASNLLTQLGMQKQTEIMSVQSIKINVDPELYHHHISRCQEAIEKRCYLMIEYQKTPFEVREYRFEPYELFIVNQFWYVSGYDARGRYITLKISRMKSVTMDVKTFMRDMQQYTTPHVSKYGYRLDPVTLVATVENRFDMSEYIWGENQIIEWLSPTTFKISVTFPNTHAAQSFVGQCASAIRIHAPENLRQWHIDEAKKIIHLNG